VNGVGLSSSTGLLRKLGLAAVIALSALHGPSAMARGPVSETTVSLAELPAEARRTEQLVRAGGPFPYAKDGTVFGNRERLLPRRDRGYYREYTVPTPGARNRGARRLVCGGRPPTNPEVCYYTADHYASFRRLVP
jgi:ribonuclease T1